MPYAIMLRAENDEPLYLRALAIRMARITPDFMVLCEQEGLVKARTMTGGGEGFDTRSIQQLALIRRLHQELELDLETIDMVIHLRDQIIGLRNEIAELERQALKREQDLLRQLQSLRNQSIKPQKRENTRV